MFLGIGKSTTLITTHGRMVFGGQGIRHLVIWFRVARKPEYTGLIRNFKSKELVVVMEDISTPNVPYLR
jgi:hypothetical protein